MCTALTEIGNLKPLTPEVAGSSTGDGFFNDNIRQQRSRATGMKFYYDKDIFRQGKFLVYWVSVEHNLADYFTNKHTTSHNC